MPWGAVIAGGAALAGSAISASAASDAADTQAAAANTASQNTLTATREANNLTASMYKNSLLNQAPGQQGGQLALSALMSGLGLGPAQSGKPAIPTSSGTQTAPMMTTQPVPQTVRSLSYDANGNLMDTPTAQPSTSLSGLMSGTSTTGNSTDPYGISNLNYGASQDQLNTAAGAVPAGSFSHAFDATDFKNNVDPGYQFRMDQGNAALAAKRAATGDRWGSQALKDITNYNQDAASQEYQNAYSRYNTNQSLLFDRLSGLAGIGTAAGNAASAAGTAAAGQIGSNTLSGANTSNNYLTSGAAARAAGTVGASNAIVGGVNNGLNNWYTGQIVNKYLNNGSGSGSGGSTSGNGYPTDSSGNLVYD